MVGNECRCVAFLLLVLAIFAVGAEHGVVVRALVVENVEEKIKGLELLMSNQTHRNFEITPMMTRSVSVIKFSAEEMSAKARKVAAK